MTDSPRHVTTLARFPVLRRLSLLNLEGLGAVKVRLITKQARAGQAQCSMGHGIVLNRLHSALWRLSIISVGLA